MSWARRIGRAWAFGRHIPARKLVRRLTLIAAHRWSDRFPGAPRSVDVQLAETLPLPVFPARRSGAVAETGGDLRVRFLGDEVVFAGGHVDWSIDPPGRSRQLWRMNLHYMEYLEEVDDRLFAALLSGWIDANALPGPGAWRDGWNAYALSIRVVVWLQQLAVRGRVLDRRLIDRTAASAAQQIAHLERRLETDIGGNHLIKNIKALLWGAACFRGVAADRWRALGLDLLDRELAAQILADGVHHERSPSYHAQVFADLLECRAVLSDPVPALDAALERMAQAIADLTHPDGLPAQFNDAGLHMAYPPGSCLDAFAAQGGRRPQPRRRFAFQQGGFFGWRDERLTLIADCGPIAPDDLPAHGHGDVLSFELSVDGQRVIVDQGVYEYVAGDRRDRSRSARSHNLFWIEGQDQADFFGAFRCGRRPNVHVDHWDESASGFLLEGSHDGYRGAPGRPRHHRRFDADGEGVLIRDWIDSRADLPARMGFLLHPDIRTERVAETAFLLRSPRSSPIWLTSTAPLSAEAAVWWPDMGVELATTRLTADVISARAGVETRLSLVPSS